MVSRTTSQGMHVSVWGVSAESGTAMKREEQAAQDAQKWAMPGEPYTVGNL